MKRSRRAGVTLMEMLVTLLVMSIVGIALVQLTKVAYDAQYLIINQNKAITDARAALDEVADRMRGMQLNTSLDPDCCFSACAQQDVTFYDYWNQYDTSQAATLVPVRFWYSNGVLYRTVNSLPAGGSAVARNLTGFSLLYSIKSGSPTATPSASQRPNIYAVTITSTVSVNGYSKSQTSYVQVRQQR